MVDTQEAGFVSPPVPACPILNHCLMDIHSFTNGVKRHGAIRFPGACGVRGSGSSSGANVVVDAISLTPEPHYSG